MSIKIRTFALPMIMLASQRCGPATSSIENRGRVPARGTAEAGPALLAVDASNDFAARLLEALGQRKCDDCVGNVVLAPVSISTSLAMLSAGAGGPTRSEILSTMGFKPSDVDPLLASSDLVRELATLAAGEVKYAAADRLWLQEGVSLQPGFGGRIAAAFGAEVGFANFLGDPEHARIGINEWTARQTGGLVGELLKPASVDSTTRLVASDAMSFSAPWRWPFDSEATAYRPFYAAGGTRQARTLRVTGSFRYAEDTTAELVELPFSGGRLVMDVLVPRAGYARGDLVPLIEALSEHSKRVMLELPQVETSFDGSLTKELGALGMRLAFETEGDFAQAFPDDNVYLADVLHGTKVAWDEKGARVAAATASIGVGEHEKARTF